MAELHEAGTPARPTWERLGEVDGVLVLVAPAHAGGGYLVESFRGPPGPACEYLGGAWATTRPLTAAAALSWLGERLPDDS